MAAEEVKTWGSSPKWRSEALGLLVICNGGSKKTPMWNILFSYLRLISTKTASCSCHPLTHLPMNAWCKQDFWRRNLPSGEHHQRDVCGEAGWRTIPIQEVGWIIHFNLQSICFTLLNGRISGCLPCIRACPQDEKYPGPNLQVYSSGLQPLPWPTSSFSQSRSRCSKFQCALFMCIAQRSP